MVLIGYYCVLILSVPNNVLQKLIGLTGLDVDVAMTVTCGVVLLVCEWVVLMKVLSIVTFLCLWSRLGLMCLCSCLLMVLCRGTLSVECMVECLVLATCD